MGTFFRINLDRARTPVGLDDAFAGALPSACWLVCGGPSLTDLPIDEISRSAVPVMTVNLAGSGLLRPNFWTSYDPTCRFLKSIYLDAGITKFVHARRATDLVPETTLKVADCPNLYFFDSEPGRNYGNFFDRSSDRILDWSDSLLQAIDILYRLGFRTLYLAGTDMRVRPSREQIERAATRDVHFDLNVGLEQFLKDCEAAGLPAEELDRLPQGRQYHFAETKPIRSAALTDRHYDRVAQQLRLARRTFSSHGLSIVSVTPGSRLNDYFEYRPAVDILQETRIRFGDPMSESTLGRYHTRGPRLPKGVGPMRDVGPYRPPRSKSHRRPAEAHEPIPIGAAPVQQSNDLAGCLSDAAANVRIVPREVG
ncbi:hypothetical protein [Stratiformator vulcanicus]|uniref:hypothetical protein n=1 Tax=Stratiformator vulcanicus TaxID=2527980 RepID=UPI0011A86785|nr:hypothetical protein [Stratiformator vulcanicus]